MVAPNSGSRTRLPHSWVARQLVAVITVLLALLLRVALERQSVALPIYITFYPVVFLVAVLGDLWAGILATALSALLVDYFLLTPIGQFAIHSTSDTVGLAIFSTSGVFLSVVAELHRRHLGNQEAFKIEAAIRNERKTVEESLELAKTGLSERLRFLEALEAVRAEKSSAPVSAAVPINRNSSADELDSRFPGLDQKRFRSFLRRTVVFPFLAALILAGTALWAAYDLYASMQLVDHTSLAIGQSQRLLKLLVDMETGERGYLVTGNDAFLQPYQEASKEIDSEIQVLFHLVADYPPQQVRLERLHKSIHHWQGYAEQMLAIRNSGGAYTDLTINLAGKGEVDEIRNQIAGFQSVEEQLRDDHYRTARRDWHLVITICILFGLCIGLGLAVFTFRRMEVIAVNFEKTGRALAKSERRWVTTLSSIGDAVVATDSLGLITFLNPVAAALTGWQPEEAVGQPIQTIFQIVNELTHAPAEDIVSRVLTEGRTFELANHTALLTKDGQEIPIADSAAPILDSDGAITGAVLVFRDVTEKRRADESLNESQAKLAAALASMTDSVLIVGADGRFVDFNDAYARFYRFKSKEECARNFTDFTRIIEVFLPSGEPAPNEMYALNRALRGETATNVEYWLQRRDTGENWIGGISFSPIREKDGAITGAVITARDITEEKQAENERQIAVDFLGIVNQSQGTRDLVQKATIFFQNRSGCEAVGIRLREGNNYPYYEFRGFSKEFIALENQICAHAANGKVLKDSAGNSILECLCGTVIRGNINSSKPFYSVRGSFWTNSTTGLVATTPAADLPGSTRHRCNREGYESLALFPMCVGEERIGLLQLADRRIGQFSPNSVILWERLAGQLATAISKFRAEEALRASETQFRNLANAIPQLCWMANADGWIFWYNERWYEYTGTTPEQMEGWGWQSVHDPDILPRVVERWKISITTGTPFEMVFPIRGADGVFRLFLTRVVTVKDANGSVVRWFGTNTDISEQKRIEAELRKNQERLSVALEVAQLGEWERNLKTQAASRSLRHAQIFGYSSAEPEWNFEKFLSHILPQHRAKVIEWFKSTQTGGSWDFETQIRRADGEIRWIWFRSNTRLDENGQPAHAYGIVQDITERKQAEEELKKLNRTLKALSNSNQAILHASDEQEYLKDVCRTITRDCGHAMVWIGVAEDNEEKSIRPAAHSGFDEGYLKAAKITWNDSERGRGPAGTAIRTGQPSICRNMLADPAFAPWRENAIKRGYASSLAVPLKEQEKVWGAITIYSREPDAFSTGEIELLTELAGVLEVGIQTLRVRAAHAQAEQALSESKELLSLFVDHAPAALAMFDNQMCYLNASQRWRADYGLGDRDLRGVSHYEIFPEIPENWKEAHRRGLEGEVLRGEADGFEKADGSVQWIRWEVRPWHDVEGNIGGVVIFTEDVTERKKAEETLLQSEKMAFQRQQLQALAERLQQVREEERTRVARDLHDQIGQILTAIKLDLTWVVRHLPNPENEVHEKLSGSIELINDGVQSVRKICSGLRPGILDDLGLAAAIEWQTNEFATRTGISCEVSVPPGVVRLDGDRATAVFRIFQECLTNIVRHAEAKSVHASLYEQDDNLMLVVEDDGKGFRESAVAGSLGILGMKERAQMCGGSVQVSSLPGKGTTVTVCVPMYSATSERENLEHPDSR